MAKLVLDSNRSSYSLEEIKSAEEIEALQELANWLKMFKIRLPEVYLSSDLSKVIIKLLHFKDEKAEDSKKRYFEIEIAKIIKEQKNGKPSYFPLFASEYPLQDEAEKLEGGLLGYLKRYNDYPEDIKLMLYNSFIETSADEEYRKVGIGDHIAQRALFSRLWADSEEDGSLVRTSYEDQFLSSLDNSFSLGIGQSVLAQLLGIEEESKLRALNVKYDYLEDFLNSLKKHSIIKNISEIFNTYMYINKIDWDSNSNDLKSKVKERANYIKKAYELVGEDVLIATLTKLSNEGQMSDNINFVSDAIKAVKSSNFIPEIGKLDEQYALNILEDYRKFLLYLKFEVNNIFDNIYGLEYRNFVFISDNYDNPDRLEIYSKDYALDDNTLFFEAHGNHTKLGGTKDPRVIAKVIFDQIKTLHNTWHNHPITPQDPFKDTQRIVFEACSFSKEYAEAVIVEYVKFVIEYQRTPEGANIKLPESIEFLYNSYSKLYTEYRREKNTNQNINIPFGRQANSMIKFIYNLSVIALKELIDKNKNTDIEQTIYYKFLSGSRESEVYDFYKKVGVFQLGELNPNYNLNDKIEAFREYVISIREQQREIRALARGFLDGKTVDKWTKSISFQDSNRNYLSPSDPENYKKLKNFIPKLKEKINNLNLNTDYGFLRYKEFIQFLNDEKVRITNIVSPNIGEATFLEHFKNPEVLTELEKKLVLN